VRLKGVVVFLYVHQVAGRHGNSCVTVMCRHTTPTLNIQWPVNHISHHCRWVSTTECDVGYVYTCWVLTHRAQAPYTRPLFFIYTGRSVSGPCGSYM